MSSKKNLRRFIFLRIACLALSMALVLSYLGTQSFLKGVDLTRKREMILAANLMTEGESGRKTVLEFTIASAWKYVPANVKAVFPVPPQQPFKPLIARENWWYFAPPEQSYALMLVPTESGKPRYVSFYRDYSGFFAGSVVIFKLKDPMVQMALGGAGVMLIFMLMLYYVFGRVSGPARALYAWAGAIKIEAVNAPLPDFQYQEFNKLAEIIRASLAESANALQREKEFLGYASHELRTPITSLRSNATLLDKISPDPAVKEREVRDRMSRATLTMTGITETLLWLSRDEQEPLPVTPVNVATMLRHIVREQQSLIGDKHIQLEISTEQYVQNLPEAACYILLTNIIRNAFQHTPEGLVHIQQRRSHICVSNRVNETLDSRGTGFGLGVKLICKLAERFCWELCINRSATQHKVAVDLSNKSPD